MTDTTAPDAITQADRDAAADLVAPHGRWPGFPADFRSGRADANELTQAAARHRRLAAHGAGEGLREALGPWADHHGPLPDFDSPFACVFDSGVQHTVELLAKELKVDDWTPCDGTEEYDGDLGGTLMNIVRAAMPEDAHGERMWPHEVRALLTPPTDAGSTTREGGEGVDLADLCEKIGDAFPALSRRGNHDQVYTALACAAAIRGDVASFDDACSQMGVKAQDCSPRFDDVRRRIAALATTSSPDASPDRGEAVRFYKLPFALHEPEGDGAAYIRDADGGSVAMLMWPGHSFEDTDAAVEETYRIGRAMAAAITTSSPDASPDSGEGDAFDQGWRACVAAIGRLGHLPPRALPDARAAFLRAKPKPDVFGGVGE